MTTVSYKEMVGAIVAFTILVNIHCVQADQEDPRSRSGFYVDTYGEVAVRDHPLAGRMAEIFERLLRVADKAEYKDPELLLVDSDSWPWAIALPDNTVVLTKGALELCYKNVSLEQGDVRLAMILGHELGHLVADDYWHRDVYLALVSRAETTADEVLRFIGERSGLLKPDSEEWKTVVRDRELKADDRGFIYAALAGFDTALLIDAEKESFFHYWTEQTSSGQGNFHLTPADRAAYLAARSGALTEISELYRLGIALISLGQFVYGEKVFRQVLTVFPAHEVYNNLGYIRLQQSLDHVSVDLDRLYWWPATLDTSPETPELQTRSLDGSMEEEKAQKGLGQAAKYFELAIKQNPAYLTGHLNLATTYYYLGKYNNAAAVLADAMVIAPHDIEVQGLWQIAMMSSLRGTVDYLPTAISKLEALADREVLPASLAFNLAQLYENAGQLQKAGTLWDRFEPNMRQLAEPYRSAVALRSGVEMEPDANRGAKLQTWVDRMVKDGESAVATEESLNLRFDEGRLRRTRSGDSAVRYYAGDVFLGEITTLSVPIESSEVLDCCGAPSYRQPSTLGDVWIYGSEWGLLVVRGKIKEVWKYSAAPH